MKVERFFKILLQKKLGSGSKLPEGVTEQKSARRGLEILTITLQFIMSLDVRLKHHITQSLVSLGFLFLPLCLFKSMTAPLVVAGGY